MGRLDLMMPKHDGCDISHHNPVRDWDEIPQYRLFLTKGTEGRTFRSPTFDENWEQMRRRAFEFRGVYHWVRSDSPMQLQVANLERALTLHGGLRPGEFVMIDWETTPGIAPLSLTQILEFQDRCEIKWPGRVAVYSSDWVPSFMAWRRARPDTALFYANYRLVPDSRGGRAECAKWNADVWQWTSSAAIPGFYDRTVDMNEVLDWATLERIAQPTTRPIGDDEMVFAARTNDSKVVHFISGVLRWGGSDNAQLVINMHVRAGKPVRDLVTGDEIVDEWQITECNPETIRSVAANVNSLT